MTIQREIARELRHRADMHYRRLLGDALADGDAWLTGGVLARDVFYLDRHGRLWPFEGSGHL